MPTNFIGQGLSTVSCSSDGKLLASGGRDHKVIVWEAATGRNELLIGSSPGKMYFYSFDTSDPEGK